MQTLREWRIERLLSQRGLAKTAGISDKTIVQIELGRQVPTFRTIRRISEALGVPPSDITEFAEALEERAKKDAAPDSAGLRWASVLPVGQTAAGLYLV